MRVAVNAWFWDSPTTGSGQYTRRLVEHLAVLAPDLAIVLIAPRQDKQGAERGALPTALPASCALYPISGPRSNLGKVWFEQVGFPHACRRLQVDVAHVPYWAPPLFPSVPTLVTIHDLIPLLLADYRGSRSARLYTVLVRSATRRAALALTDSEASRQDIVAHLRLPVERIRVAPLAADGRFTPAASADDAFIRACYGLPPRYILYLGGFDVRKNLAALMEAFAQAGPVIGEECPLIVAGRLPERDTPFTPDPRRLALERGLGERWVRFIGHVAEDDKPALYRGATAFVFLSRYEGFGLPPLEALACGTPVVASKAASLPEVVGDAGVLLQPDDAAGIAAALIRLATDAEHRAELSRRALAQAARFSWEHTAQETLKAYHTLAPAR